MTSLTTLDFAATKARIDERVAVADRSRLAGCRTHARHRWAQRLHRVADRIDG